MYRLSEQLRAEVFTAIVESGKIKEYSERLCEFEQTDAQQWVSAMIRLIFDGFGNANFISTDATIRAGERIIRKYGDLTVCQFALFVNQWESGEYGHDIPTLPRIQEELKLFYLKNVDKPLDEDYSWNVRDTLLNKLDMHKADLYGGYSKADLNNEKNKAYMRYVNGNHGKDDLFLLATFANGVISSKDWNWLSRNFDSWIARKTRTTSTAEPTNEEAQTNEEFNNILDQFFQQQ